MRRLTPRERAGGYAFALVVSAAAIVLRLTLEGVLTVPFITLFPAIMASGWWGGFGPAMLSVAIGALAADYLWLAPRGEFSIAGRHDWFNLIAFIAVGGVIGTAAARLRALQRRFRSLLEDTHDGFAILGRDWQFLYVNPRMAEMCGSTVPAMTARSVWEILPEADEAGLGRPLRAAMQGTRSRATVQIARLSRWVEAGLYPVSEGVAILGRDVTAARDLEARRAELLGQLEAANRLKDEFLATVSHELRTPLNALMGWTQILQVRAADPGRAIASVLRNAEALKSLVDDLLDTSRIVTGKLHLEVQATDFARVVRLALETAGATLDQRHLTLAGADEPVWVMADPARLQQSVQNLVANAIKFTPSDGRIDVSLMRRDQTAILSIRDTGIGIPPELLPRIFDRFVQADAPVSAARKGLGLGLAITRHIVEAHGGTVVAASHGSNCGATFTVTLPLARDLDADPPAAAAPSISLLGTRVLVVVPDAELRELLGAALERAGASVQRAARAEHALALLPSSTPDLVVTGMDPASEAARALVADVRAAALASGQAIRVLAIGDPAGLPPDRFDAHLPGEWTPGELTAVVHRLVSGALD